MHHADQRAKSRSDDKQSIRATLHDALWRLVDHGRDAVRERPLTAVGGAALAGFVAGSLTPKLIAQPIAALALRALLSRVSHSTQPKRTSQ